MSIFDGFDFGELAEDKRKKIIEHAEEAHKGALEAAKLSFKDKMNGMDAKVKAAEELVKRFAGIEPEEIEVLRKARGEAGELKAALDALKAQYQEKESALLEREAQLKKLDFSRNLSNTVHQYNVSNPTVSVRDDMMDVLEMIAAQRVKEVDGQTVYTKPDGSPIIKGDGYGDASAFIEHLRSERPSLFNAPSGGGAPGQASHPGSAKQISRADFERLNPAQQMDAIKKGATITD